MSDAASSSRSEPDESTRCFICNQSRTPVTVVSSNTLPIHIKTRSRQSFTLLPETNIKLQRTGDGMSIQLSGNPSTIVAEPQTNVELALATDMSLDIGAEDLMQITLIDPVTQKYGEIVKCGDGPP